MCTKQQGKARITPYTMQADVSYANIHWQATANFCLHPEPFPRPMCPGVAALRNFSAFETWNQPLRAQFLMIRNMKHINWEGLDLSQALSLNLFTQLIIWLFDTSELLYHFHRQFSPPLS